MDEKKPEISVRPGWTLRQAAKWAEAFRRCPGCDHLVPRELETCNRMKAGPLGPEICGESLSERH